MSLIAGTQNIVKSEDVTFLMKHLNTHAYKWKAIGNALNFQHGELDNISQSSSGTTTQQLLGELLSQWSQWPTDNHTDYPTMERLCNALRNDMVGLGAVANELFGLRNSLPSSKS